MFSLYRYRLPFSERFTTAAGSFENREGFILRYRNSQCDLIGESAPLTGFSSENHKQVQTVYSNFRGSIEEFYSEPFTLDSLAHFTSALPQIPSFQFGVSSLGLMLLCHRSNQSLSTLLNHSVQNQLEINAVIGIGDRDYILNRISDGVDQGFRVFKIKTGNQPGELAQILNNASSRFPGIQFRIDANRSWPLEQISILSELFAHLPVEYLEEPVRLTNIRQITEITERSHLPIALDESIPKFGYANVFRFESESLFYILKPMLLGNLIPLFATISRYDHLVDRVIFTTALESIVGRRFITLLAGIFGSRISAHGLNTGDFFSYDLSKTSDDKNHALLDNVSGQSIVPFNSLDPERLEKLF
ncbi:hypothetical protein DYD21_19950 [Rhodohalobacter sp. SW132]|uniref:enolase C-terminal domain-like protein n=1 Tax=Rhodohalobacter sp. SW132 TaxID=2293433 RepID=UPI000E248F8D|nr:enolase C-terminal domain-like protein [Rhodohalobacter sp. SW132]REL24085.1 hypothetical protein DYD21_19950 [Rhodohalobacter sp. SW132]